MATIAAVRLTENDFGINAPGRRKVVAQEDGNSRAVFSPDGLHIAFLRGMSAPAKLVVVNAKTGEEKILTEDAAIVRPVWRSFPVTK